MTLPRKSTIIELPEEFRGRDWRSADLIHFSGSSTLLRMAASPAKIPFYQGIGEMGGPQWVQPDLPIIYLALALQFLERS